MVPVEGIIIILLSISMYHWYPSYITNTIHIPEYPQYMNYNPYITLIPLYRSLSMQLTPLVYHWYPLYIINTLVIDLFLENIILWCPLKFRCSYHQFLVHLQVSKSVKLWVLFKKKIEYAIILSECARRYAFSEPAIVHVGIQYHLW